jgi:hypothetical protein
MPVVDGGGESVQPNQTKAGSAHSASLTKIIQLMRWNDGRPYLNEAEANVVLPDVLVVLTEEGGGRDAL